MRYSRAAVEAAHAVATTFARAYALLPPTMSKTDRTDRPNPHVSVYSTDADLITEVDPNTQVYDDVRERAVDEYERRVDDLLKNDVRSELKIESIQIDPLAWSVYARIRDVDVDYKIDADGDVAKQATNHIRTELNARFACLDAHADAVAFKRVDMKPGAWFVEAILLDRSK